jgi:hypothetical protein
LTDDALRHGSETGNHHVAIPGECVSATDYVIDVPDIRRVHSDREPVSAGPYADGRAR